MVRAPVSRVINRNTVFVCLDANPLNPAKQHTYRKGDVIACRRREGPLGERWEALSERELYQPPPEVPPANRIKRTKTRKKRALKKAAPKKGKR
jgi:hypothetical protein